MRFLYCLGFLALPVFFSSCTSTMNAPLLSPDVATRRIARSDAQLLDVRTKEEYREGHIAEALNIDVKKDDFVDRAKEELNPSEPVLVYCRSGTRSARAAEELKNAGFTHVQEIEGGYLAWKKAGKPIVK